MLSCFLLLVVVFSCLLVKRSQRDLAPGKHIRIRLGGMLLSVFNSINNSFFFFSEKFLKENYVLVRIIGHIRKTHFLHINLKILWLISPV